jgi:hypothetical protein
MPRLAEVAKERLEAVELAGRRDEHGIATKAIDEAVKAPPEHDGGCDGGHDGEEPPGAVDDEASARMRDDEAGAPQRREHRRLACPGSRARVRLSVKAVMAMVGL